jgi:hypothetical protein
MSIVRSSRPGPPAEIPVGRHIICSVHRLQPHPTLIRLQIVPSAQDLSAAMRRQNQATKERLTITQDGFILAGHARWNLARRQGETTLPCLQLDMTEEEALLWLIQKHQRSDGLNAFCRIVLALELEPWFKARAGGDQQLGGQKKGSSNLSEADRLDVRREIAAAAGVSTGNVSKVKQLASAAHPQLLEALRAGEVSIHKASVWLQKLDKQLDALGIYQNRRSIKNTVNALLRAHYDVEPSEHLDAPHIAVALARLGSKQSDSILVAEIRVPGVVLLVSTALRQALTSQGELNI